METRPRIVLLRLAILLYVSRETMADGTDVWDLLVDRSQAGLVRYYHNNTHEAPPLVVFVYDPSVGPHVLDEYGGSVVVCLYGGCQLPSEFVINLMSPQYRYGSLLTELLAGGPEQHKELIILNDVEMQDFDYSLAVPLSFMLEHVQSADVVLVDINVTEKNFLQSLRKVLSRSDTRKFVFLGTPSLINNITLVISDLMTLVSDTIWLLLDTQGVFPSCASCGQAINILRDDYVQKLQTTILIHSVDALHVVFYGNPDYATLVNATLGITILLVYTWNFMTGGTCEAGNAHCSRTPGPKIESVIQKLSNSSTCHTNPSQTDGSCRGILRVTLDQRSLNLELKRALRLVQHQIRIYQSMSNGTYTLVGVWSNNTESSGELLNMMKVDTQRPALRIVTIHDPPYVFKRTNQSGSHYSGYAVDLLNKIAELSNIPFTIKECTTRQPFVEATVFAWGECIEDILLGKADMIIGPISVTKDRSTVVDFILPYVQYDSVQMLTRTNKGQRFDFLKVFDYWSLLTWLGCFIFSSIVLWMYENIMKKIERKKNPDVKYCSLQDVVWFIVTKAEFECDGIRLSRTSTKLMSFAFWLLSFILLSAFTANLASFMTVYRLDEIHVNSISDLVHTSNIEYSLVWGSDEMVYFENMMKTEQAFHDLWKSSNLNPDSKHYAFNEIVWDYPVRDTFTQLWDSMTKTGFFNSTTEALERVAKGNFILLSNTETVKYLELLNCEVKALGHPMGYRPIGFALKKDSRLFSVISRSFMEIQQSSALESLRRKWWENGTVSCGSGEIIQEVAFTEIAFWFLTPIVGLALGMLVLSIERFVRHNTTKNYSVQNGCTRTQHYGDIDDSRRTLSLDTLTTVIDDDSRKEMANGKETCYL